MRQDSKIYTFSIKLLSQEKGKRKLLEKDNFIKHLYILLSRLIK